MRLTLRTAPSLLALLIVVVTFAGCQRERAENSLRRTQQKLAEIEQTYNGVEHVPNQLENIRGLIQNANNTLATDAGQALTLAGQASSQADQALEAARPAHANTLFSEAEQEISVADVNDLPRIDPTRYQRIIDLRSQAQTARTENEWDELINLSQQIIQEVDAGLAGLRTDAQRAQIEADAALTDLLRVGGNRYAPEVVISVRTEIERAQRNAEDDRDYVLAKNKFDEAAALAEQGIVQVLRRKSLEAIEQIEDEVTEALIEGAKQFLPDDYERVTRLYEDVQSNFEQRNYQTVIEASTVLLADAQTLVIETKRAASDDRIDTLQENIAELERGRILDYIPGALDELRQFLAQARDLRPNDDEPAFDQIKEISIDAADEYDRQRSAFQTLAQDAIRGAKNQIETTRSVFDQMDEIFEPVDGPMTSEQRAFEAQKQARQTELGTRITEASSNLVTADLRQQQGEFANAIVLAEETQAEAEEVLSQVYHTVGHNAAIEIAGLISRYERDGAREYAPEELARATEGLEQVKMAINNGNFRESVETAAQVRADVELMAQSIAGRATEDLREARAALDTAASAKTRRFRAAELEQVRQLIAEAEAALQDARLKAAVETARRATELARAAEAEANQLSADEALGAARVALTRAQNAGAELYAGRDLEDARRLLSSAQTLYAGAEYVRAEELAVSSRQRADNGLFRKINEAEASIATAKAVGAWGYDDSRLASANTRVREARQLMEQNLYQESADRADAAKSTADGLVVDAKRASFNERVDRIRRNLEVGSREGLNFFQPEESIAIRRRLVDLQNAYSPDSYERVMTEIEELEGQLRTTLDTTDELVITVADQLDGRLDRLVDAGALTYAAVEIADARENLRYARLDYRRGLYKAAHTSLDNAIQLVREVESRENLESYAADVRQLFSEYLDVQQRFRNVLQLDPAELKSMALGTTNGGAQAVAILGPVESSDFRVKVEELYSRALVMEVPEEIAGLHQSVIEALALGRLSAQGFEKLIILDRLSMGQAVNLIDDAYANINNSNRLVNQIETQLLSSEFQHRMLGNATGSLVTTFN